MDKRYLKLMIFVFIFVIGIIIIMNSIKLGRNDVIRLVDSMTDNELSLYLEQSIINYRFAGTVLSILGGLGVLKNISSKV